MLHAHKMVTLLHLKMARHDIGVATAGSMLRPRVLPERWDRVVKGETGISLDRLRKLEAAVDSIILARKAAS